MTDTIDRDKIFFPRNDYTPDFSTSLNFNFNAHDVFGARVKKVPVISLIQSKKVKKFNLYRQEKWERNDARNEEKLIVEE